MVGPNKQEKLYILTILLMIFELVLTFKNKYPFEFVHLCCESWNYKS